jgi:hypothetical protein
MTVADCLATAARTFELLCPAKSFAARWALSQWALIGSGVKCYPKQGIEKTNGILNGQNNLLSTNPIPEFGQIRLLFEFRYMVQLLLNLTLLCCSSTRRKFACPKFYRVHTQSQYLQLWRKRALVKPSWL